MLAEPQLVDERGQLLCYDRVVANPPFRLKEWRRDFAPADPHHRFDTYGATPPRTRANFAFLQHMLAVTNPTGMVGVVMPHGVLFRGGAEKIIRSRIIAADLLEAIIGLAPNLLYGASIPVAICILNRDKPSERRGRVLFIDANQPDYFRAGKTQNLLEPEHAGKIVEAFRAFEDVDRFAHVAELKETGENEFNLNIGRYVDTTEADRGAERRGSPGAAARGGAGSRRGGGADGRAARGAGVCRQRLGTPSGWLSETAGTRCGRAAATAVFHHPEKSETGRS